jgi:hypothetical protein
MEGRGFVKPLRPHEHWHVDIAYLNLAGTLWGPQRNRASSVAERNGLEDSCA